MRGEILNRLLGDFQARKAEVESLNLEDDIFFSVVMKDLDACSYLLSVLMEDRVTAVQNLTQLEMRNLIGRSARFDFIARDSQNRFFGVEMQNINERNLPRRMRHSQAIMDCDFLDRGINVNDLPETYTIFITRFDPFGKGQMAYKICQHLGDKDSTPYDDGIHKIYLNTKIKENTHRSELLQYIRHTDLNSDKFGALSERVNYYKNTTEGVNTMSEHLQQLIMEHTDEATKKARQEGEKKGALKAKIEVIDTMINNGFELDKVLEIVKLDKKIYEKHKKNK